MSECDSCPEPGHCCKEFKLTPLFPRKNWRRAAINMMKKGEDGKPLPFVPIERAKHSVFNTKTHTQVAFTCPLLDENGRCSDYENRPFACRKYQPREDALCILYKPRPMINDEDRTQRVIPIKEIT